MLCYWDSVVDINLTNTTDDDTAYKLNNDLNEQSWHRILQCTNPCVVWTFREAIMCCILCVVHYAFYNMVREKQFRILRSPLFPCLFISLIYFWNKILHVSDSSSVHHQEFFNVHIAMVYVIQVC